MHSILSRFRSRAISQTTSDSSGPATPTNLTTDHALPLSTPDKPFVLPIERKIHPDVNSLLEEYSAQPSLVDDTPRRRNSVDGFVVTPLRPRRPSLPAVKASPLQEDEEAGARSLTPSSAAPSARAGGSRFLSRISSIATAPGEWSTFGRAKKANTSLPDEFGEQPSAWRSRIARSKDRGGSTRSSTTPNRSGPSTGPTSSKTPSRKSSDRHLDMNDKENSEIVSSRPPSQPQSDAYTPSSSGPRSSATPASHAHSFSSRFARISTPVARQLGFDSPRTFGQPSPHNRGRPDTSPPPPLPPLDHPDLVATLGSRSPSNAVQGHLDTALFPQNKTYPPRSGGTGSRQRSRSNTEAAEPRAYEKRAIRPYRSLPRAQHIFHSSSADTRASQPSRSRSTRHGRRVSADLFARQAATGVVAGNDGDGSEPTQDWAARVSQEMIRLSLAGATAATVAGGSGGRAGPAAQTGNKGTARGRIVPTASPSFPSRSIPTIPSPSIPALSPSLFASFGLDGSHKADLSKTAAEADGLPNLSGPSHGFPFDTSSKSADTEPARGMQEQERVFENKLRKATNKKPLRSSLRVKSTNVASSSRNAPSLMTSVSATQATPETTPTTRFARSLSDPSAFQTPDRSERAKGKRKAEEVDITPPELKTSGQKATSFAIPSDPRIHRSSTPPHAPSSYHRKRARLSSPLPTPAHTRPGSAQTQNLTAHNTGTASSRTSTRPPAANASFTRGTSMRSARASIDRGSDRRHSLSGVSIPISALVTPHAPSVARTSQFHMRDPRRPPKKLETPWSLRRRTEEEEGSPVQAWLFFLGFVLFPLWWLASVLPTPKTRQVGGSDTEKAVTLDDPQIEFDAKSWRFRCRIMSLVSLFTYIPFIVLIAIFAPR